MKVMSRQDWKSCVVVFIATALIVGTPALAGAQDVGDGKTEKPERKRNGPAIDSSDWGLYVDVLKGDRVHVSLREGPREGGHITEYTFTLKLPKDAPRNDEGLPTLSITMGSAGIRVVCGDTFITQITRLPDGRLGLSEGSTSHLAGNDTDAFGGPFEAALAELEEAVKLPATGGRVADLDRLVEVTVAFSRVYRKRLVDQAALDDALAKVDKWLRNVRLTYEVLKPHAAPDEAKDLIADLRRIASLEQVIDGLHALPRVGPSPAKPDDSPKDERD